MNFPLREETGFSPCGFLLQPVRVLSAGLCDCWVASPHPCLKSKFIEGGCGRLEQIPDELKISRDESCLGIQTLKELSLGTLGFGAWG